MKKLLATVLLLATMAFGQTRTTAVQELDNHFTGTNTFDVQILANGGIRTAEGIPTIVVGSADVSNQGANVGATTLHTPTTAGLFRVSGYAVVTQAATTSSTLPRIRITYVDADTNTTQTLDIAGTSSTNTVGTNSGNVSPSAVTFYAKAGSIISYATTGYTSSGATPLLYAIHLRAERIGN